MKYIKGLDALRALAVAIVVIGHSRIHLFFTGSGPVARIVQVLLPTDMFGVDVFFVLSGFLISSVLLHADKGNLPKIILVRNFIVRRTLRIFPVYYLTLLILWIIQYPDIHQYLGWFLTYTSNILCFKTRSWNAFSHSWSLSVEEQFYLIWPWLLLYVNKKYFKYLVAVFILTGPVSSFISTQISNGFSPILTPNCFDSFGIGALYAWCSMQPGRMKRFKNGLSYAFPIACFIYFSWKLLETTGHIGFGDGIFNRTINSVIAVWMIDYIIKSKSGFWEIPILIQIGKISYGIYLFHIPISMIVNSLHVSNHLYVIYAIKLSALLLISYVSYYFFELKVMDLKKKFTYSTD
ncbi:MAG TPA: acyltransferase [Puia sp.]